MISKSSGYAIRAITYLVVKSEEERKLGIHEIAESLGAPQHFLAKILQELVRRKVIGSTKGPHGGFYALSDSIDIPILRIVEIIDGLEMLNKCQMGREECSNENPCPLHYDFVKYRNGIIKTLEKKTIGDLGADVMSGTSYLAG
ncbi:Rrf2 family protein [Spirosomataceae bacterium TFI 002]|nr:Rrf2 family protein [Spirosomataceae bacterium TFI 002]